MCGIVGIFSYHPAADGVDDGELTRLRDAMAARGPDGFANWVADDRRIGFGHRRLAFIDLSEDGLQPMHDGDGRTIVFNGEIYNYRALRAELQALGHGFRTQSDTEVILRGFAQWGDAIFARLRGMFAIGLWDARAATLTLVRGPYGIKPLYYADDGRSLRFASSVQALLQSAAISRESDPAGEAGFYMLGSVPEPFTSIRAIKCLPAGHILQVTRGQMGAPRPYVQISALLADAEMVAPQFAHLSAETVREQVGAALRDSVAHHLVSDVPIAVFLSSGLDSGAILALAKQCDAPGLTALTLGFAEYAGRAEDEVPLARQCAAAYDVPHHVAMVGAADFAADREVMLAAMDQPSIDGPNSWFISKFARASGFKGALSGLGGDEFFGGYPSFVDIPRWRRQLGPIQRIGMGRVMARMGRAVGLGQWGLPPKAMGLLQYGGTLAGSWFVRRGLYMPWELPALMGEERAAAGLAALNLLPHIEGQLDARARRDFTRIATLEASLYMRNQLLRDTDWASMAHSVEVRIPLVDLELLRAIAPLIIAGRIHGKTILGQATSPPLPAAIRERRKTGFTIPVGDWVAGRQSTGTNPFAYTRDWAKSVAARHF
ncbi:MAG: asparagine synthase (glutamine-hydrolyzing) [Sphingomonadaceae bacterium]|nr:asparagine synthase (glutamine-hydrolyzing) [Sphingomonadaceae bacterium]